MENNTKKNTDQSGGFNRSANSKYGQLLFNQYDKYIGRSIALYGEYCEEEVALFKQICVPGDSVIEVGSNIGAHMLPLARFVGERGHVYAFEPQRLVFQTLCANAALNSLTNVTCYPYAVSEAPGQLTLKEVDYQKANNFGGLALETLTVDKSDKSSTTLRTYVVQLVRLDDVIPDVPIKLLKIDVEGMEAEVIKGSESLIEAKRPYIYLENDRQEKSSALIEQLWALDYEPYWSCVHLYNNNNFNKNKENVFDDLMAVNMLCLPKEHEMLVKNMKKVESSSEHPLRQN